MKQLLVGLMVMLVAAAISGGAGAGVKSPVRLCAYKSSDVVMVLSTSESAAKFRRLCAAMNTGFKGHPFHGHYGQIRCMWYDPVDNFTVGLLTDSAYVGKIVCTMEARNFRGTSFIRTK